MAVARRLAALLLAAGPALAALDLREHAIDDWEAGEDGDECMDISLLQYEFERKDGGGSLRAALRRVGKASDTQRFLSEVCLSPSNLTTALSATSAEVLKGLPHWSVAKDSAPTSQDGVHLAFLIQLSYKDKLPLVSRTFSHIYSDQDVFLYLVDEDFLDPARVRAALPNPLPSNVFVEPSKHAGYYYWPRVSVLLQGLEGLLAHDWDFVVHLSESDYPVHSMAWMRKSLAVQRRTSFVNIKPRCANHPTGMTLSTWYWWSDKRAVATCKLQEPKEVASVDFPMEAMEEKGFVFAQSPEWFVLTRELVQYATSPQLQPFRQLISAHTAADEIFWATMVLNIPGLNQSISPQGWFMQWTGEGHSPDTLTMAHEKKIAPNRRMYFFVRKVEEPASSALLQRLDDLAASEEDAPGPGDASWVQGDAARSWSSNAVACLPNSQHDEIKSFNPDVVVSIPAPAPAPPAVSSLPTAIRFSVVR